MIMQLLRYLWPKIHPRQKLPLLPRAYSSHHTRDQVHDPDKILALQGHALAQTKADAQRLLYQHQGEPIDQIVQTMKRKRRREPRMRKAWRRFKRLFQV